MNSHTHLNKLTRNVVIEIKEMFPFLAKYYNLCIFAANDLSSPMLNMYWLKYYLLYIKKTITNKTKCSISETKGVHCTQIE